MTAPNPAAPPGAARIRRFLDEPTRNVSDLVWDHRSRTAGTEFADRILAAAAEGGVAIRRVLETHAHADHLAAAPHIQAGTGAPIGIGEHITEVQRIFRAAIDASGPRPEGGGREVARRARG